MNGVFKVSSVKEVRGMIFNGWNPYKYGNKNRIYTTVEDPKALLIRGELDGKDTSFFSPTVIVSVTSGIINYKDMKENPWFLQIKETPKAFKGDPMFDGGKSPNFAIATFSTITPKIKEGDVLNISFKPKGEFNGTQTIKNVKIV